MSCNAVASNMCLFDRKRSFRTQLGNSRKMKSLKSVRTLANHLSAIGVTNKQLHNPRKQPISVSQQFQQSLHSLMVTLNQANPFFIRCIKSNAEKVKFFGNWIVVGCHKLNFWIWTSFSLVWTCFSVFCQQIWIVATWFLSPIDSKFGGYAQWVMGNTLVNLVLQNHENALETRFQGFSSFDNFEISSW